MKPANIKLNMFVRVTWYDSAYEPGWIYRTKPPFALPPLITVGKVTHVDSQMVEIASTFGEKGALNPLCLPWGAIVKLEKLHGD
jgi:hypothetical protein